MKFLFSYEQKSPKQMEIIFPFPSQKSDFRSLYDLRDYCAERIQRGINDFTIANTICNILISYTSSLNHFTLLTNLPGKRKAKMIVSFSTPEKRIKFEENGSKELFPKL